MAKPVRPIRIEGDIAYVPLTKGYEAVIDAADAHLVEGHNWYAMVRRYTVYARRNVSVNGKPKTILMHRVIMRDPDGFQVDHEDGNGLHNRRKNLRTATGVQNTHNQRKNRANTSGLKGVTFHKQRSKWQAQIAIGGKRKHLGLHETPEQAHAAYCAASAEFHKDFGRTA